jgi:hypothetical protein
MVYDTKANKFSINRTADLTGLTREQVVRAMSNERRRLKAQGSTAAGPKVSKETAKLAKQLKEIRESLQDCIDQGCFPFGLEDEVEEVACMMVCSSVTSSLYLSLTTFRKRFLDSGRLKRQCKLACDEPITPWSSSDREAPIH